MIDVGIEVKENSGWKFDKEVVSVFDTHVRKSVPMYDEIHKLITEISDWFIEDGTNVYDIGTSTGECIYNLNNKYKNKNISYIGIDLSKDMIEKARDNLKEFNNVSIIHNDINSDDFKVNNASLITSILTLQFIPKRKRQQAVNKIYEGLNKGGAFILVEKIIGNNARFDEMFIELYHDLKLNNGLSEKEVFAKSRSIRGVMSPNTVDENLEMLSIAGFKDTDIFFKWCNFIGIIAIK